MLDLPFPEHECSETGNVEVGFTLFGRGNQYLPYVLHALEEAGRGGIGRRRIKIALDTVEQRIDWGTSEWKLIYQTGGQLDAAPPSVPNIPVLGDSFRIEFETPLRLRRADRNVKPDGLRFADLFVALMRRISMLSYFHTDTPHETDFRRLAEEARKITFLGQDMRWRDWTRYSSRQKTAMQMGGLLGSVDIDGSGFEEFWPYLWMGQWTHAGKGTSMGLGKYRLVPIPASLRPGTVLGG